ncbi:hypothetical protein [Bacillus toyonensis]|uniref:Uncharacterized protein n=1 Tax=Bacillus toyonensis TaxID=155322 RepID=A0AB36SUB0_9BACI|nr:hypothetical protein [Bacillus toyonensis]MED2842628.1 hypothetical protein [Bacillus toyonensis]PEN58611.1 hypothetical protein CN596_01465 [Bacillus toyonensis]
MLRRIQGRCCYTRIVTIEVIDNKVERDNLVNRVEVLEKVKNLLLLPELEMATTQQVADFYNVSLDSLRNVIKRHREELTIDGYKTKTGKEVTDSLRFKMNLNKIETKIGRYVVTTDDGTEYSFSNKSNALFPKRAILRVGMLLRDSEVAKEVRTQLLNIEENTAVEVKTYEIDYEVKFLGEVLKFTELWRSRCFWRRM